MNNEVDRLNSFRDVTDYGLNRLSAYREYDDRELMLAVMASLNDRLIMVENEVLTLKGLRTQAEEKDDDPRA